MGKVVEIDCEKSMKLETSRNVTKSKRSLHWCRSISTKYLCTFITVSVKKLLHYRAGGLLQYRAFYYIIGQLLHYRAFFITLSGSYYSIGRLLHYRLVQRGFGPGLSRWRVRHSTAEILHSIARKTNVTISQCLHKRP